MKKEFVIYHNYIPKVGGIESAIYNLAKALDKKKVKVTILYGSAESPDTLLHYAEVADVYKTQPDLNIECKTCLIASNHIIPKIIKADKFYQWIHSDYDKYALKLLNKGLVEYIAVSKHCANVIKKREKVDSKVIYNLLDDDFGKDKRKILKLVTNSRISPEKGFGRMVKLAEALKEKNIRFKWVVYGDNSHFPKEYEDTKRSFSHIEEVQFVGYKQDVSIGLTDTDYLVQLSNFEGCPYSILEALKLGIPCIVTNWGGVEELISDRNDGYILPMETERYIDYIDKIVNDIPKVEPKELSNINQWLELI